VLREWLLARWRKNVYRSFLRFLVQEHGKDFHQQSDRVELERNLKAGRECLWCAAYADWWEWSIGSHPFFWRWRWPQAHRLLARDGYPPFVQSELPKFTRPQPFERNPETRSKVKEKLSVVRNKKYIHKGEVRSLTSLFGVPKGDTDIRMVYDASKSRLNTSLWAPNFALPTVDTLVRGIDEYSWLGDIDIGEMFLNFVLHEDLQPYAGVDLRPYWLEECPKNQTLWERWVRCLMGLKPSPYKCIKALLLALEVVRGDKHSPSNPFHWDQVLLNLLGIPHYDPTRPRLSRVQSDGSTLAALLVSYVDDMRTAASSEEDFWRTIWMKTKALLDETLKLIDTGESIDRKTLDSFRGSLVYLQRTYPAITPYVKGYHLTIDGWRPDRDEEGWCCSNCDKTIVPIPMGDPPAKVTPVPRFRDDVLALIQLFSPDQAPT